MQTLAVADMQTNLDSLVEQVVTTEEPVLIQDETHRAVLVSEEEWVGIQQNLERFNTFSDTEEPKLELGDWVLEARELAEDILAYRARESIDFDTVLEASKIR